MYRFWGIAQECLKLQVDLADLGLRLEDGVVLPHYILERLGSMFFVNNKHILVVYRRNIEAELGKNDQVHLPKQEQGTIVAR